MDRFLGRYTPQLFAILRIVAGLMFALHGMQKLFGWPGENPPAKVPLMVTAGVIEAVCGVLIAIGFLAGWAAFVASGEMAVAYFMVHWPQNHSFPLLNMGEAAVLYCFLFLYIAAHGAGIWSVERAAALARRRS